MRIEFFIRSPADAAQTMMLLKKHCPLTVSGYNLPNKVPKDPLLATADAICAGYGDSLDLCVHYSLKYNSERRGEETVEKFKAFLARCPTTVAHVLLVTGGAGGGGKPRKAMNAVTCLEQLQKDNYTIPQHIKLGVAFNPYYPTHMDEELARLEAKLRSGYVSTIWLNMGSDTDKLQAALKSITTMDVVVEKGVRLVGSVFIPSKALLNKFRFRMWSGLYLDELYMKDVEGAMSKTETILDIYEKHNVEPLIESAIRTEKDVQQLTALMTSGLTADSSSSSSSSSSTNNSNEVLAKTG